MFSIKIKKLSKQIIFKIMKKVTAIFLFLICLTANSQSPKFNLRGNDTLSVKMSQMCVNIKVVGNIAYTTAEMHFFNSGTRQMEAELLFPLPEGVSVSRYAIDINGKIREAVPVNKSKGKQVFEAIEHRRVDPGLLEKVDGNNFRTRVYPLNPNSERIVIIGYEQELTEFDKNNLGYQLLSRFPQKLDKFEVNIDVLGAISKPIISGDTTSDITFQETTWNKSYQTSIKKTNYQPSENLLIKIPIQSEIPSVVVQSVGGQHYFYANTNVEGKKIHKKNPEIIGLIWDVSLSCMNRDIWKELDLLDKYFKEIQNTQVSLYFLSYDFKFQKNYTIANGNWADLKNQLENAQYDGGTRFSQVKFNSDKLDLQDKPNLFYQAKEYLFFTDGLSSLSENKLAKSKVPVYTITSSASSDYAFLNYSSLQTGANFINLNSLNIEKALDKLVYQTMKFFGIKDNIYITDLYPITGTPVSGNFSVSGISMALQTEITLLFGFDNNSVIEKKIIIDAKNNNSELVNIEKLWAQKKIANLEIQYQKNAEEIEILGNKYGIITQNTSLIVLESLADYILYDIVPPSELLEEFDRIKKQESDSVLEQEANNWNNIDEYYDVLNKWWKKNKKFNKPIVFNKKKYVRRTTVAGFAEPNDVEVKVADPPADYGPPLASPAYNRIELSSPDNPVVISDAKNGNDTKDKVSKSSEPILEEVVVAAKIIKNEPIINSEITYNKTINDSISNNSNQSQNTETNTWNPDRLYLKSLKKAKKEAKYLAYLKLREENLNNPNFYFDVANYFYNQGDKQKALLVLSNIADLGLENHQLYKSLTYVFRQWQAYQDALYTANKVAKWRPFEPQSHRDLGLTLEDNKQYQAAFDELLAGLQANYYPEMSGLYQGIEDIILMDLNRMKAEHPEIKTSKLGKKYLNIMPVSIRVILNWNTPDTDIDLHVIEPTGEDCYFGNIDTKIGARFSKDFTQGYGPEQYLLRNAVKGKYQIRSNFYVETELTENGPTTVMVEIYTFKNGKTTRKLQTVQSGKVYENKNLAVITIE